MAYTANDARNTLFEYLNIDENEVEFIENTNKRGFIFKNSLGEKSVIFIYPISHKKDNTKNFFDTRDSGAYERGVAWNYALQEKLKYFCFGVHDQVQHYKDYIFSLECDEKTIEKISGTKNGSRVGKGTQVVIPNDYRPSKKFERIYTKNGFFISVIVKDSIFDYIEVYDNRPYLLENELVDINNTLQLEDVVDDKEKVRVTGGSNILLYGVPGAGKSRMIKKKYCSDEKYIERVVFHPDYTYSDFVGQILPKLDGEELKYEFTPGPFTKILKKAYEDPGNEYYLIIEEINRGNAPAIFGEIFQLLDRIDDDDDDDVVSLIGESKYGITNYDIAIEVYENEEYLVKIPSNLYIIATMNTADQNVFTLDTAFQRRWDMEMIRNDIPKDQADNIIEGTEITWGAFANEINNIIISNNSDIGSSEDKRLGAYFVKKNQMTIKKFPEKVLKYLWDDAFKMDKTIIFKDSYKSLEDVIKVYEDTKDADNLRAVLNKDLYEKMLMKSKNKSNGFNKNEAEVNA